MQDLLKQESVVYLGIGALPIRPDESHKTDATHELDSVHEDIKEEVIDGDETLKTSFGDDVQNNTVPENSKTADDGDVGIVDTIDDDEEVDSATEVASNAEITAEEEEEILSTISNLGKEVLKIV